MKRPWYVYLMACWAFMGIGGVLSSLARIISRDKPDLLPILGGVAICISVLLCVSIVMMKKKAFIVFGTFCCVLVIVHSWAIINFIFSGRAEPALIVLFLFYLIPSAVFALLSLRPKFLHYVDQYNEHRKHNPALS